LQLAAASVSIANAAIVDKATTRGTMPAQEARSSPPAGIRSIRNRNGPHQFHSDPARMIHARSYHPAYGDNLSSGPMLASQTIS
jgi:hypothetical protein